MICIDKLSNKLSHHDLVVIEGVLNAHRISLLRSYNDLSDELDSLSRTAFVVDDNVVKLMKKLCYIYDTILEIDRILSYYSDIRKDDFFNSDYRL